MNSREGMVQTLESGRRSVKRGEWDEGRAALAEADRSQRLSAPDLELLAEAAWWAGDPDQSADSLERAFSAYVDDDMVDEAARVAALLAYFAVRRLAFSVAGGWKAKAERLLDGRPESKGLAFVKLLDVADALKRRRDLDTAKTLADETIALARRTGTRDVEAQALVFKGEAEVASGNWEEGLALIDEATASALSGNLSLRSASDVYCITMATCSSLNDYERAGEWTERADRWMGQNAVGGYPGMCRVHRAELKRRRGAWSEAEEEALGACSELERYRLFDGIGMARYEVGEIKLAEGDLDGAEEAFTKAFETGWDPQPGLALLLLARGRPDEAAHALERSLTSGTETGARPDLLARARILPGQVEVALARNDVATAQGAVEQLERIAGQFDQPALTATARFNRGRLDLYLGETDDAIRNLETAWKLWRDLQVPYDNALARMLLGQAHLASGETGVAAMELRAARSIFERLGANPDLRRVDSVIHGIETAEAGSSQRVRKTFVFTDIVNSTDLIGLVGDTAWDSLLSWHDRELRSIFERHNGVESNHTGDGFFVTFDSVGDAVAAAAAIQRRLSDHRRDHGFAPSLRIGIHTDEATLDNDDYRGRGVHLAARVGGVAGADEIVVSTGSLGDDQPIGFPISDMRSVDLKGISDPVEVATVDWR